jgi:hypothetical protein
MTSFWLNDPCVLFSSLNINPFDDSSNNEKYNALTRLSIIVLVVAFLITRKMSVIYAGLISILFIILMWNTNKTDNFEDIQVDDVQPNTEPDNEIYTVSPDWNRDILEHSRDIHRTTQSLDGAPEFLNQYSETKSKHIDTTWYHQQPDINYVFKK